MVHSLVSILALAVAGATAADISRFSPRRSAAQTVDIPEAPFVAPIIQRTSRSSGRQEALRGLRGPSARTVKSTRIAGADGDEEYLTNITIGGQNFKVIIDTGSSDTWLAGKGYSCFDLLSNPVPQSQCAFGTAGFDAAKSKTYKVIPDTNFNISYGDGEFLTGTMATDTVSVAGLAVPGQEIGVVTKAAWNGDGVNTGLIGLAFPNLTSAFSGTDPDKDTAQNLLNYNPFFFTAVAKKLVAPFFSISLDRGTFSNRSNSSFDSPLGFLAFGGIPNGAQVPITEPTTTVPIQRIHTNHSGNLLFYYYVDVDGYTFPGSEKIKTASKSILDTGTTLTYVPTPVAQAFNAAFDPPATISEELGGYIVDCNATAPPFSATIGGKKFTVDGRDNIVPFTNENNTISCFSGTQDGGVDSDGNIFILGDVFLHNVLSTFNIRDDTVTLHQRKPY